MADSLLLDLEKYEIHTMNMQGITVTWRVFPHITYVTNPVCEKYETMSIYVPEAYFHGGCINGWTAETAPVFVPTVIGAYAAAVEDEPGPSTRAFNRGDINAAFMALFEGYVVACPAVRGRGAEGKGAPYIGTAPAQLVDFKAAIRYLRHNAGRIPGNMDHMITNGTSAGGAMSALMGTTGNCADYEPYLKEIGAADEKDDIFAASCYCPITNLEHADMAYEWLLKGFTEFHSMHLIPKDGRVVLEPYTGILTDEQLQTSAELRALFIEYVNSLGLKNSKGEVLSLDADGCGSFRDYVISVLQASAQKAVNAGIDLSDKKQLTIADGVVTDFDLDAHMQDVGRMKSVPSFDFFDATDAENELFGTLDEKVRHFSAYSFEHDTVGAKMASEKIVSMMNPMCHLDGSDSTIAKHIRIRHGSHDPHTSFAISAILALGLANHGQDVDFAYQWGKPHSGDYDLRELFDWINQNCR